MMLKLITFLAVVVLCFCQPPPGYLQVNSPQEIAGQYFASTITYKGTPTNLIGSSMEGTLTSIANLTTWLPGNILLVFNSGVATDFYLRNFFPLVPKAIVLITFRQEAPGFEEYTSEKYYATDDIVMPIAEIGLNDGLILWNYLQNGTSADIKIQFGINPWAVVEDSGLWIAAQVFAAACCLVRLVLALVKLVQFRKSVGFQFSVAQVSLLILLYNAIFSLFEWIVDPLATRKIYPYAIFAITFSHGAPLNFVAATLTISFWHEILSMTNLRVTQFINRMFIPFFAMACGLLIFEYAFEIARAYGGVKFETILAYQIIFSAAYLVPAIYYLYTMIKLIAFQARRATTKDAELALGKVIVAHLSVLLGFFGLIFLNLYVFSGFAGAPEGFRALFWCGQMFQTMISLGLILSFVPNLKKYKGKYSGVSTLGSSKSSS